MKQRGNKQQKDIKGTDGRKTKDCCLEKYSYSGEIIRQVFGYRLQLSVRPSPNHSTGVAQEWPGKVLAQPIGTENSAVHLQTVLTCKPQKCIWTQANGATLP